jgi:hypothetical protein
MTATQPFHHPQVGKSTRPHRISFLSWPKELDGSSDPLSGILHTHSNYSCDLSLSLSLLIGGSELAASRVQQLGVTPSDPRDPRFWSIADFLLRYRDFALSLLATCDAKRLSF